MARPKKVKVDTKDFVNCPLEQWNGTTFREYMKHLHTERNLPYIHGKVMLENQWVKQLVTEFGNENVKKLFELAVKEHKTSIKYPTVTIYFLKHYLLQQYMPRVLQEEVKQTKLQLIRQQVLAEQGEQNNVEDYF